MELFQAMETAAMPAVQEQSINGFFDIDTNTGIGQIDIDTDAQDADTNVPDHLPVDSIVTETDEDGNIIGILIQDEELIDNLSGLLRILNLFNLFKKTTTTTTTTTLRPTTTMKTG